MKLYVSTFFHFFFMHTFFIVNFTINFFWFFKIDFFLYRNLQKFLQQLQQSIFYFVIFLIFHFFYFVLRAVYRGCNNSFFGVKKCVNFSFRVRNAPFFPLRNGCGLSIEVATKCFRFWFYAFHYENQIW